MSTTITFAGSASFTDFCLATNIALTPIIGRFSFRTLYKDKQRFDTQDPLVLQSNKGRFIRRRFEQVNRLDRQRTQVDDSCLKLLGFSFTSTAETLTPLVANSLLIKVVQSF